MKGFSCLWITLFSCTFVWRTVTPAECGVDDCYADAINRTIFTNMDDWEQFCGIVGGSAETCLASIINEDAHCMDYTDFLRTLYLHVCSVPFESLYAGFSCLDAVDDRYQQSNSSLCQDEFEPLDGITYDERDYCGFYTVILQCYDESLQQGCPESHEFMLHYFMIYFGFVARLHQPDCQLSTPDQDDMAGTGSSVVPSSFHWFMVVVATISYVR